MHLVERRAPSISPQHPPHRLHKHPHLRQHQPPRRVNRPHCQLLGLRILQRNGDQAARLQVFRRVPARQQRNADAGHAGVVGAFEAVEDEAAGYAQSALLVAGLEGPGSQLGGGDALVLGQVAQYAGAGYLPR